MTISSENTRKNYSGDGSTTVFPYNFKIVDATHLKVVIADSDDSQTTLVKDTHYTVDGVGEASGGDVTLLDLTSITGETELPTGWTIAIYRDIPLLQETDFENQGGFFADTHEDAFDLLTMTVQQLQEQVDRCPKVTTTSGIDADGYLVSVSSSVNAAAASAAAASTSAASASASAAAAAATGANVSVSVASASASAAAALVSQTSASTSAASASASAALALAYTNDLAINVHEQTGSASQTTIDISSESWTLAQSLDNIQVYIDEQKKPKSSLTRTSDTVITLDTTLSGGEKIEVLSSYFNPSATSEAAASAAAASTSATSASTSAASASASAAEASATIPLNYVTNANIETDTTGYATYANTAQTTPVDATNGTASSSISRVTASPLRGTGSLQLSKPGSNVQGEGFAYGPFTIENADVGNGFEISFDYSVSGTFSDGDIGVYLISSNDNFVADFNVISPTDTDLPDSSNGNFTTTANADASDTSYKLVFHIATTSTETVTVDFDNIVVRPSYLGSSGGGGSASFVGFSAYSTSSQSMTYTGERIIFNKELFDTLNMYDHTTGIATIPVGYGGRWTVRASAGISHTFTGQTIVTTCRVESTVKIKSKKHGASNETDITAEVSKTILAAEGEDVDIYFLHSLGVDGTLLNTEEEVFFEMEYKGAV